MKRWKNIPLRQRLLMLLGSGTLLIGSQFAYFSTLTLIAGMMLLLICFFSLREAPAEPYVPALKLRLFYAPIIMAALGGIAGFVLYRNLFLVLSTSILGVGIYSIFIGEILLSFKGMFVYKGFYAYTAATIFCVIALFIITVFLTQKSFSAFVAPGERESEPAYHGLQLGMKVFANNHIEPLTERAKITYYTKTAYWLWEINSTNYLLG
jgi:hypothetical protein